MNNTDTQEYHLLNLPGCNDHNNECHLGQFLHSIEDLIPTNWKRECRFKDESSEPSGSGKVTSTPEPIHGDKAQRDEF